MDRLLALIGPILVRLVSGRIANRIVLVLVKAVFDLIEKRLMLAGYTAIAGILDDIEADILADLSPLVEVVEREVQGSAPMSARLPAALILGLLLSGSARADFTYVGPVTLSDGRVVLATITRHEAAPCYGCAPCPLPSARCVPSGECGRPGCGVFLSTPVISPIAAPPVCVNGKCPLQR